MDQEKLIKPRSHRQRDPGIAVAPPQDKTAELVERLVKHSSSVLIKKLATNDRQWAIWNEEKHKWKSNQAGPLLPALSRTSEFFPPLEPDPEKPHNRATTLEVYWPTTGKRYTSKFTWYSEKGDAEHHFTNNPRSEFAHLAPASYLLIFKPRDRGLYQALTVDAADDDLLEYVTEVFEIGPDCAFKIMDASAIKLQWGVTGLQQLIVDLIAKLDEGPLAFDSFVSTLLRRSPQEIGAAALKQWKDDTGCLHLNPYQLHDPGDVLFELTRVREFSLYKQDEAKTFGAQLVRALVGEGRSLNRKALVTSLIERFDVFYDICKSAKQARSSRAGGSFEFHMGTALKDGGVPHSPQVVFDGSRPDFVLPSGSVYANLHYRNDLALVLTLKTTLRERWKQVVSESTGCPIFLATLDESVPGSTLDKLERSGITLVVPEKFKTSEFAEYESRSSVISYRAFFDTLLAERCSPWLAKGIGCFGISP
jgi:hypothetical protein